MKIFKEMAALLVACILCAQLSAMQKPPLTNADRIWLKGFLEADRKNDANFLKRKSDVTLNKLVSVGTSLLTDSNEFEALRKYIGLDMSKEELKLRLNNIIKNAKDALPKSVVKDEPINVINRSTKEKLGGKLTLLYNFIEAEIKGDNDYINFRPVSTYEMVIAAANKALKDNTTIALFKNEFKISENQVKKHIRSIIEKATDGLGKKSHLPLKVEKSDAAIKAPAPVKPAPEIQDMSLAEKRVKDFLTVLFQSKDLSAVLKIHSDKNLELEYMVANSAMYDDEWINEIKNESGIPAIKVKALLEEIRQQIGQVLAERGYKNYADHFKKKEKKANGPWPEYPESPR
jgi:hypothetical protein